MVKTEEGDLKKLLEEIRRILETPFWIPEVSSQGEVYRLHDDTDGTLDGLLIVSFPGEGDILIATGGHRGPPLRFRTHFGGGKSLHVRNALQILAYAMLMDNAEHPQFPQ